MNRLLGGTLTIISPLGWYITTVPFAKVRVLDPLKISTMVTLKANCSAVSFLLGGGAYQYEVPFDKNFSKDPSVFILVVT